MRKYVPIAARIAIITAAALALWWLGGINKFVLAAVAVPLLYRHRRVIDFGILHGSSRWARKSELRADGYLGHRDGVILGRWREPELSWRDAIWQLCTAPLAESENCVRAVVARATGGRINAYRPRGGEFVTAPRGSYVHGLICAPAGKGKGEGFVKVNALNYRGSMVILDPKGEIAEASGQARTLMGQRCVFLNPMLAKQPKTGWPLPCHGLNIFDLIPPDSPTLIEDSRGIAEMIVIRGEKEDNPYFNDAATGLIHAVILAVVLSEPPGSPSRNLASVRRTLASAPERRLRTYNTGEEEEYTYYELRECLAWLVDHTELCGGNAATVAGAYAALSAQQDSREWSSILSTACTQTTFLDSELVQRSVSATDFDASRIQKEKTTVYMIMPAEYLGTHNRLLRLWVNALLLAVKKNGATEADEIMFLLDEAPILKEMKPLEEAVALMRGYGLRVWLCVQSLTQLETSYVSARWKTLVDNLDHQLFMGVNSIETARFVVEKIGKSTRTSVNVSNSGQSSYSSSGKGSHKSDRSWSRSQSPMARDTIMPDELMREDAESSVVLLRQGKFPALLRGIRAWKEAEFGGDPARGALAPHPASYAVCALAASWLWWMLPSPAPVRETPDAIPVVRASMVPPEPPAPPEPEGFTVRVSCEACGSSAELPSDMAGTEVECTKCGSTFTVGN